MSQDINPNKIGERQKRHAEHLKDKFEHQGMGQDEAKNRALEEVAQQINSGGGNSGGDSRKGDNNQGGRRNGSQSNESK